jgi:hypothetical protein
MIFFKFESVSASRFLQLNFFSGNLTMNYNSHLSFLKRTYQLPIFHNSKILTKYIQTYNIQNWKGQVHPSLRMTGIWDADKCLPNGASINNEID